MIKPFSRKELVPQPKAEVKARPYHAPKNHSRRCLKYASLLLLFTLGTFFKSPAQEPADYSIHANIIYHFTKYIDWPENKKTGDFIVGIVGETPLYEELIKLTSNKWVGSQKIVVRQYSAFQLTYDCQILFIAENESHNIKKIAKRTSSEPILIVTEDYEMRTDGICIHFTRLEDKLSLEINKMNIKVRKLRVANELLELAKVIN